MTEPFDLPDGRRGQTIRLESGPMSARILTLGATVQELRLGGRHLMLGLANPADYLGVPHVMGAILAPVVNRVKDAAAMIGGTPWKTEPNWRGHLLHSGPEGAHMQVWEITAQDATSVTLSVTLNGPFPGPNHVSARYDLTADALHLTLDMTTDAPTLCAPAFHPYFNFGGASRDHHLRILADHYLPTDSDLLPTGEIAAVEGTAFDFRDTRAISQPYDSCFCLSHNQRDLRLVAWLTAPDGGLTMELSTTEPGLQLFLGDTTESDAPGLDGDPYGPEAGIALEAQNWPSADRFEAFPNTLLKPGGRYRQETRFRFTESA
ncbi:aldose epimerase family protein [Paracoccaceae bacterium GXU_MW_L88]